jgi:hypothetical protein
MTDDSILEKSSKLSVNKFIKYSLAYLLFALSTIFIELEGYGYLSLIIYIIVGLFIFTIASNKFAQFPDSIILVRKTFLYVCLILFFISFAFSIGYLLFFESLYSKSLWYYFFIGICTSTIFIISVTIGDNSIKRLLPCLTFVLGLNIFVSNFIVFPNGVYASGDTHYQIYNLMLPILENGNVPFGFSYSFFPIHQIFVASLATITGIEPIFLYMSATSLLYAVSALFIYSSINRAAGSRFGITAMLLFITAPTVFYHATHVYQFSYALPLGILLIYITMVLTMPDGYEKNRNLQQNRVNWKILHILAIGVIIWTHQFTSTIIFLLIVLLGVTNYIISKNNVNIPSFHYSILSLYIVMLIAHWMYVSSVLSSLVRIFDVYYSSLFTVENYQVAFSSLNSTSFLRPLWLIFIDMSGRGIIMMLATMGFLYGAWKKNRYVFGWMILGSFLWTLISIGSYIEMPLLLGGRMLAFFEAMSIIYLATFGIMLLIERFGAKGLIFCSILLFVIPIFSLGSTTSGSETSLFVGDQPNIKFYDTFSDLQYRDWIKNMAPENSTVRVSESWVLQYTDNARVYVQLPINDQDQVADNKVLFGEYIVLNKHDSMGLRVRGISEHEQIELVKAKKISTVEAQASYMRITKLDISEIKRVISQLEHIYSNGENNICIR